MGEKEFSEQMIWIINEVYTNYLKKLNDWILNNLKDMNISDLLSDENLCLKEKIQVTELNEDDSVYDVIQRFELEYCKFMKLLDEIEEKNS